MVKSRRGWLLFSLVLGFVFFQACSIKPFIEVENAIKKSNWPKVNALHKQFKQEADLQPAAYFARGEWFLRQGIYDSALANYFLADKAFTQLRPELIEGKQALYFPADSLKIKHRLKLADSSNFVSVYPFSSGKDALAFLGSFPYSFYANKVARLADSLLLEEAKSLNTTEALDAYLSADFNKSTKNIEAAKDILERLRFKQVVGDGRLPQLKTFLAKFPNSPFAPNIRKRVLEILLAKEDTTELLNFSIEHKGSTDARLARYFSGGNRTVNPQELYPEAWATLIGEKEFYVLDPVSLNKIRWGTDSLDEESLCFQANLGYLKSFSKGKSFFEPIYKGLPTELDSVAELGWGAIQIKTSAGWKPYTLYGTALSEESYLEIEHLRGPYCVAKKAGKEQVILLGYGPVTELVADEVKLLGKLIWFKKGNTWAFTTFEKFQEGVEQGTLVELNFKYQEVSPDGNTLNFRVKEGGLYFLLDENGKEKNSLLKFESLEEGIAGQYIVKESNGQKKVLLPKGDAFLFPDGVEDIKANAFCYAINKGGKWGVVSPKAELLQPALFDTLQFLGRELVRVKSANLELIATPKGQWHNFSKWKKVEVITTPANASKPEYYIVTTDSAEQKFLFNAAGKPITNQALQKVWVLGNNKLAILSQPVITQKLIQVKGKNTKRKPTYQQIKSTPLVGVIDSTGKQIIENQFDGITSLGDNYLFTLKAGKFGLYRNTTEVLSPKSETLPIIIKGSQFGGQDYIISTSPEGIKLHFPNGKEVVPKSFAEYKPFGRFFLLLKDAEAYKPFHLRSGTLGEAIGEEVYPVNDQFFIFRKAEKYGLLSADLKVILPAKYDDLKAQKSSEGANILFCAIENQPDSQEIEAEKQKRVKLSYFSGNGTEVFTVYINEERFEDFSCPKN